MISVSRVIAGGEAGRNGEGGGGQHTLKSGDDTDVTRRFVDGESKCANLALDIHGLLCRLPEML